MLETITFGELLAMALASGGTLAVLLERLPFWNELPGGLKAIIVAALNVFAPMILAGVKIYVPPQVLAQTPAQVFYGLVMLAAAFIVHKLDVWLSSQAAMAKSKMSLK